MRLAAARALGELASAEDVASARQLSSRIEDATVKLNAHDMLFQTVNTRLAEHDQQLRTIDDPTQAVEEARKKADEGETCEEAEDE